MVTIWTRSHLSSKLCLREIRTDLTTDAEAIEDISAKIDSELSHKLNFSFLYMMQKEGVDMHNFIEEAEVLAQQVIDKFPPLTR